MFGKMRKNSTDPEENDFITRSTQGLYLLPKDRSRSEGGALELILSKGRKTHVPE